MEWSTWMGMGASTLEMGRKGKLIDEDLRWLDSSHAIIYFAKKSQNLYMPSFLKLVGLNCT